MMGRISRPIGRWDIPVSASATCVRACKSCTQSGPRYSFGASLQAELKCWSPCHSRRSEMPAPEKRLPPIHALVVDDEPLARRNLTVLLHRDPDIASVVECESGMGAVEEIRRSKPDLVFLDVQMPECGGFDVLELLGNELPTIIFVTAYDEYALRAFEAGAVDYL